jgi:hypothetical protein
MTQEDTMATSPKFRFLGTTDDVIDCERCGKQNLRATVVLEALDADGNAEDVVYFGSDCAARALRATGKRTTAATVRKIAEAANRETAHRVAESERLVAHYAPFEGDDERLIAAYARAHSAAMWLRRTTDAELLAMARDCLTRHRARIVELRAALNPAAA